MADLVTQQELFDGQASFSPKDVGLILAFQKLWDDHKDSTHLDEWPAGYYNDLGKLAHTFNVGYKSPKHIGSLTTVEGVGSSTTVH